MKVELTPQAVDDLVRGSRFYEQQEHGLGEVFVDALSSDLKALRTLAGIHRVIRGRYRCLCKRFPYSIYYVTKEGAAIVQAILDSRSDPRAVAARLR